MSQTVTMDLSDSQLATPAATIATCSLMCLTAPLPPHKLLARKIQAANDAIVDLAKLGGKHLPEHVVQAGGHGWVAAMEKIAEKMKEPT